jgi:hypothetical protein
VPWSCELLLLREGRGYFDAQTWRQTLQSSCTHASYDCMPLKIVNWMRRN